MVESGVAYEHFVQQCAIIHDLGTVKKPGEEITADQSQLQGFRFFVAGEKHNTFQGRRVSFRGLRDTNVALSLHISKKYVNRMSVQSNVQTTRPYIRIRERNRKDEAGSV